MGRPPTFDRAEVVGTAAATFLETGYEGTSIDDLVRSTGLHRGSLYQAFGSKRGLFLAALRQGGDPAAPPVLDLLLVALAELAPRDPEVRDLVAEALRPLTDPAAVLGRRLLTRAQLTGAPR